MTPSCRRWQRKSKADKKYYRFNFVSDAITEISYCKNNFQLNIPTNYFYVEIRKRGLRTAEVCDGKYASKVSKSDETNGQRAFVGILLHEVPCHWSRYIYHASHTLAKYTETLMTDTALILQPYNESEQWIITIKTQYMSPVYTLFIPVMDTFTHFIKGHFRNSSQPGCGVR